MHTPEPRHLEKLDSLDIPFDAGQEIRCFVNIRNEHARLPFFLEHYRKLGVGRFFVIDNGSDDNSREYILSQPDCHCFHALGSHFESNIWPPRWNNALMGVFGDGYWCVAVDADELLVYPRCEDVGLARLAAFLEAHGHEAMIAFLVDMYGSGPIARSTLADSQSLIDATPYFDPQPGWFKPNDEAYPSELMFGGVRERVFWKGRFKQTQPPCLTKVPFVKWTRERQYVVAQHMMTKVHFSALRGALLHFKFVSGFEQSSRRDVEANADLAEKTLEERQAYIEAVNRNPELTLYCDNSVRYRDSEQLVELGWMRTDSNFEALEK